MTLMSAMYSPSRSHLRGHLPRIGEPRGSLMFGWLMLGVAMTATPAAAAENPWAFVEKTTPPAASETTVDQATANVPASALPDAASVDWSALNAGQLSLSDPGRRPSQRANVRNVAASPSAWSRDDRPEGFSSLAVKETVTPFR